MEKVAIFGAGALAKQIVAYNQRYDLFDIVALIDDNVSSFEFDSRIPVYDYEGFINTFPAGHQSDMEGVKVICSIGYVRCNEYREKAIKRIKVSGYQMTNFISPGANCWPGSINEDAGVLVFDNAFVGVGCHLGEGVIISEGTVLSHNVTIEPYCFFSDGVVVGGHAIIGRNSFIGLNSTIKSNCRIGDYNIIGSGANVIHNTEDYCVATGNPAIVKNKDTLEVHI